MRRAPARSREPLFQVLEGVNAGIGLGALTGVTFGVGRPTGLAAGVTGLDDDGALPQLPALVRITLGWSPVLPSELIWTVWVQPSAWVVLDT